MSFKNTYFLLVFLLFFSLISCGQTNTSNNKLNSEKEEGKNESENLADRKIDESKTPLEYDSRTFIKINKTLIFSRNMQQQVLKNSIKLM